MDRRMDRRTDQRTDRRTDEPTDTPFYRDARAHLKTTCAVVLPLMEMIEIRSGLNIMHQPENDDCLKKYGPVYSDLTIK